MSKIYVTGLGPGAADQMTIRARKVLEKCPVIIGYTVYIDLIREEFPDKTFLSTLICAVGKEYPDVGIEIVPGITAASGGAAVLGAPLMHDFAVISLSDLLTPWEKIERRVRAAAEADFVICIYNPASKKRADYLKKACEMILEFRRPETVCGIVRNIGRDGESYEIMSLEKLRDTQVDMFTTVFIGNSNTMELNGRMVTPRGYKDV